MFEFGLLTGLLLLSILTIVTSHRFPFEQTLRYRFGIDRDWWIPLIALFFAILTQIVSISFAIETIAENIDIIILIFTFGVLAEGLAEANVFKYISHKALNYCDTNTRQLIIILFFTTSLLTLVTTNDIVILVMTPILIDIAYRSGLNNMKLLLLSQFVAANTLSMGLLIGSPTNIIISETLTIGFIEYAIYMLPIAIIACLLTSSIVLFVYELSSRTRWFADYQLDATYTKPDIDTPSVTREMKIWSGIFIGFVFLTTIVTEYNYSLLWCSIPTIIAALIYWRISSNHPTLKKPLKALPYGVFFFGLTFFILVGAITQTQFVTNTVYPILTASIQSPLSAITTGIFGSGILVNTFNDLPAAVFIAEYLETAPLNNTTIRHVFIQAILVGVNIGVYITQAGALAGIIWFNQMRVYKRRYNLNKKQSITFPSRIDLIKYGSLNFILVGLSLTIVLYVQYLVLA